MAYIKDKVKPVENSRGPAQGSAGSESSQTPKTTIVDVIEWVRLHNETKLWKIDTLDLSNGQKVTILVGRAPTRDNTRTFPAIVIRLLNSDGNVIRDYTLSARVAYYLIAWYSETTDRKAGLLIDFVKAMSQFQQRVVNTDTEDLGE